MFTIFRIKLKRASRGFSTIAEQLVNCVSVRYHSRVQLVSRSLSRTVIKPVKSCTRITLCRAGGLAVAFSSLTLTVIPMPSTTIFVGLPPEKTFFSDVAAC